MTQVDLHHLSKQYTEHEESLAVHQLDLTIPAGKITALLGPSGCGKTTVLKMIAGLLPPTQGDILFDGQSVLNVPAEQREAVMAFQNHLLFPHMSVGDNVGFGLKMRGLKQSIIKERVAELLSLVHLPGLQHRRPKELSGGQQQRVALARALIVEPRVLLLDEPLSNLDAHLRGEMRDLIRDIQQQLNLTTIFVTHDQEEAVILADQIALMFEGTLQQFGRPHDFYERPRTKRVAQFFGGVNFIAGEKQQQQVETAFGMFQNLSQRLADGPVWLTIRPETLLLNVANTHQTNCLTATLQEMVYLGTHARFKCQLDTTSLELVTETDNLNQFSVGQPISLYLPSDKIWLVPR